VQIEKNNKIFYRIKSQAEVFERIAEKHQLTAPAVFLICGANGSNRFVFG
jgi:hypothetical protein